MDRDRRPGERVREEPPEDRVPNADAAVRDRVPDRPRLVRTVDPDRPALRPAGEHVGERRDAKRGRPVRARRIGRDQPLVHVVAPGRRGGRVRADGHLRAQHRPPPAEERQLPRRDVDEDPRPDAADLDGARLDEPGHAVGADRQLDAEPARAAIAAPQRRAQRSKSPSIQPKSLPTRLSLLPSLLHRIADGQNIVAIDAPALHVIGARFAVKFAHGRPLFDTKTHAIQIIYHKIDDGQVIDPGKVE